MAVLKFKTFLLLLLLLLLLIPLLSSSGMVESFKVNDMHAKVHKDLGVPKNMRKLLILDHSVMDYDDAGANQKHDPRKKPGGKA